MLSSDEMEPQQSRSARSYRQYCAVARGLDVIGERWTLLIVRDLLVGPKRYKDLLDGLPGIGTNLLATRLRELEERRLIRRTVLPPPAGSTVYELTEEGRTLEPVVMAIGRWGVRFMDAPREADFLSPTAFVLALRAIFRAEAAAGLNETYELRLGGRVFEVRVADGRCATNEGRAAAPDAVITTDTETFRALRRRELSAEQALASGRLELDGDPVALERFVRIFAGGPAEQDGSGAPAG